MMSLNGKIVADLARLKVESLGEPGFLFPELVVPEWKWEYLYFIYPDKPSKDIDEDLPHLLAKIDFESPRAKAFHAGWDHAIQRAKDGVNKICEELS